MTNNINNSILKTIVWSIVLATSWCVSSLWGYDSIPYTAVKSGVGIRPLGMGSAFTAIGEEGGALTYNPAGLAIPGAITKVEDYDMNGDVYDEFSGYFLYKSPIGFGRWELKDFDGNSASVTAIGFGQRGNKGIDWGVTYKNISASKVNANGLAFDGWSADFGMLVHFSPQINFGFTLKDVFKKDVEIPTTLTSGVAFFTPKRDFILAFDLEQDRENGRELYYGHAGMEAHIAQGLVVRGGVYQSVMTGGLSVVFPFMDLDVGVLSDRDTDVSRYMLGARFGRGAKTNLHRRRYSFFKPSTFAYFRLGGNLTEGKSEVSLFGGEKIGSNDLLSYINQANEDKTCKGYVIRLGSLGSDIRSLAVVQEIRKELEKGKKEGKKIYVYIENWATLPEYYLASIADQIIMPELGTISHLGIEMEVLKTKDFMENFGIEHTVISSGAHKAMTNPYTDRLSESDKLVLEGVIGDLYHQILFDIKESRHLNWSDASNIFDGRFITAQEAKEKGLVDTLEFWEFAKEDIEQATKTPLKMVPVQQYYASTPPATILSPFNRIAVVEVDGFIGQGSNKDDFLFGSKGTGSDEISYILNKLSKDFTVRGVILRVNSPGGSIVASDQIYASLTKLREKGKIVYTSFGNVATSGGYYISLGTDKIYANPGTLTGSIGVISVFQNYEQLQSILGIDRDVVKTGKYADLLSPNKSLTEDERALLENYQTVHYNAFLDKVKKSRKMSGEEVADLAQGQLFTGEQAKELNLIDDIGNFYDVVDSLAMEIDIKSPQLVFFRKPGRFELFSSLFGHI